MKLGIFGAILSIGMNRVLLSELRKTSEIAALLAFSHILQ